MPPMGSTVGGGAYSQIKPSRPTAPEPRYLRLLAECGRNGCYQLDVATRFLRPDSRHNYATYIRPLIALEVKPRMDAANEQGSSDYIAQCGRDEIADHRIGHTEVGTLHHGQRNIEHIGN